MKFRVLAQHPVSHESKLFLYDNVHSTLCDDATGLPVDIPESLLHKLGNSPAVKPAAVIPFSPERPLTKDRINFRKILIKLGSACNYDCGYCRQRVSENPISGGNQKVQAFLDKMPSWYNGGADGLGQGTRFELWGGEPFVYWKTLKPLAEGLLQRYPQAKLFVVTNGSLLDMEKVEWLDRLEFSVVISHDGPGQDVRGEDPFENKETKEAILSLYQKLKPHGRIGFNAVLNQNNPSLEAIRAFFIELTGDPDVSCGAGTLADPLGESTSEQFIEPSRIFEYRKQAFEDIRSGVFFNFKGLASRMSGFMKSIAHGVGAETIGGRCSMHLSNMLSVDLDGNVTTCNNTNYDEPASGGRTHKVGEVSNLDEVCVDTMHHWSTRIRCGGCPMLHVCKGGCPYLTGPDWESACEVSYSDSVPIFSAGFEFLTGHIPIRIEASHLPENRKYLFGMSATSVASNSNSHHRLFPVRVVMA